MKQIDGGRSAFEPPLSPIYRAEKPYEAELRKNLSRKDARSDKEKEAVMRRALTGK